MTAYQLLDLALSLSNRIDTNWTLFISVHLALIGGIIYVDRPLIRNEKIAAVFIYTGFAVINYFMMKGQAEFLHSIYQQVYEMKDLPCCVGNRAVEHVAELYESGVASGAISSISITHLIMYVLLVITILHDGVLPKNKPPKSSDD